MKGNKFGDIIAELRKAKGLTQKELADKLGTTDKSVSRWETYGGYPNIDMIYQISKFFKISFYNLLEVRMQDDNEDDEVVDAIINEFHNMNKRNSKIIKFILLIALTITILLIMTMIFTNSYNKFKVYRIQLESDDFYPSNGYYVETKIKDILYINNLRLRNIEINNDDIVNVDLYYKENNQEHIIQSFSDLDDISFTNFQESNDLSKYFDNLYLKVTIIDEKEEIQEYNTKLKFEIDFSNNKIYNKDLNEITDLNKGKQLNIEEILLNNGFVEIQDGYLQRKKDTEEINYIILTNKINYTYENSDLSYRIVLNLNTNIIEVRIYTNNNIQVEEYTYDINNGKVIDCNVGKCNNYDEIMEKVNKNILNLIK